MRHSTCRAEWPFPECPAYSVPEATDGRVLAACADAAEAAFNDPVHVFHRWRCSSAVLSDNALCIWQRNWRTHFLYITNDDDSLIATAIYRVKKKLRSRLLGMASLQLAVISPFQQLQQHTLPDFQERSLSVGDSSRSALPSLSRRSIAMPEISEPCAALFHPTSKGCKFSLSGWCLNGHVTACTSCNVDGCICETPPPSEASRASPALSAVSQSADENGRSPKGRKTIDDFHPTTPVDNMQGNMDSPPSPRHGTAPHQFTLAY